MARIYWHESAQQSKEFTSKLLKWWLVRHGATLVAADDAPDLICVSFCSPREVNLLASARKVADSSRVPLLAGGCETYTGATYLAWADYLCVGEGYELLRSVANSTDPVAVLEGSRQVLRRTNPNAEVAPNYEIPWHELPPVQTTSAIFYYLHGRGCKNKCRFCMTSWTQPHQIVPVTILTQAEGMMRGKQRLLYVSNEAGIGSGAGSMMLRDFLAESRLRWPMVIRLGVEGLTEERRRSFAKPMPDGDIAAAIRKAKEIKRQLELFFIIGWPDDPSPQDAFRNLIGLVGVDGVRFPRVFLKFTWFEPSPHTPMARWDLNQLVEWDYMAAAKELKAHNARFRVFRSGRIGAALWSAAIRRCEPGQATTWARERERVSAMTAHDACAHAAKLLGPGIVTGATSAPWERVRCQIKTDRSVPSPAHPAAPGRGRRMSSRSVPW